MKHNIAALRALDLAHHLPAQQDHGLMQRLGGSQLITRAQGCTIWDGDGRPLLDGMAGLWCVQVGYGRAELAQAAAAQMMELPFYNTFFKYAAPPTIELAARLAGLLGPPLNHIFFGNSGSDAIDTVIRLARHYWQARGQPERTVIIGRVNGYHGSSLGSGSLGGMAAMHAQGGPWVPGFEHVMQPYGFGEGFGEDPHAFGLRAARAVEDRILAVGPERVAAFVGEPVQGAGGVIIPPESYWPEVERICRRHGILLCTDEVICGFGRLGAWFGFQHYGIQPDLVAMAKGLSSGYLPISAVGVADFIVDALRSTGEDFVHGYTYSGHPTCAAVALKNLDIIADERLVERTRDVSGPLLATLLARLADHPLVGETRSLGLLGAVEIVAERGTNRRFPGGGAGAAVRDACIARGLMVRAVRDSIVMSPPLVIAEAELARLVETIRLALDDALAVLRPEPSERGPEATPV